jgi:methylated-DNA-[protein]-cysteine S-methyltransferase
MGIFTKGIKIMTLHYDEFASPVGRIFFVSSGDAICALDFEGYGDRMHALLERRFGAVEYRNGSDPQRLKRNLKDYFDGDLTALDQTPVCMQGTAFQEQVWNALRTIPAGRTWTYGQLAAELGRPQAARAVGHANSQNPIAIIVPCHRVIGASSSLTGYAGGLHRKQWLLGHEGAISRSNGLVATAG